MPAQVCSRACALVALTMALAAPAVAFAQSAPASFKVAWFNIQSGKGEPGMAGHLVRFSDTANCTDSTQPVNAWAIGMVQEHLTSSIGNDPKVVALGLAESWTSVCASPENVRRVLGWKSKTSERNGVAMVARYGFAGPEDWRQLDTTLNPNPADTMWVLRIPVCLDAACSQSMNMFAAHWYSSGTNKAASYDRQAVQTAAFLQSAGGAAPHVLIGDLNVWDGSSKVCDENPTNIGLQRLRAAGYVDSWPLLHGSAEGFTGMTNRPVRIPRRGLRLEASRLHVVARRLPAALDSALRYRAGRRRSALRSLRSHHRVPVAWCASRASRHGAADGGVAHPYRGAARHRRLAVNLRVSHRRRRRDASGDPGRRASSPTP